LFLAYSGSGVAWLAAGYVVAGALGLIVYGALLVRVLHERGMLAPIAARRLDLPFRELFGFTVPLLTNDLSGALLNAAGAILVGVLVGAAEVAELRAVMPISLTLTYVLSAFGLLFLPLASRLHARGDEEGLNRLYWQTAAWSAVLSLPVFMLATAFADPLTTLLFGDRYASSASILGVLVLGHFVTVAFGPNNVLLAVHGRLKFIVLTNAVAIVVNLALAFALIPPLGALGAAIAGSATLIVVNAIRQVGLARSTSSRGFDREYLGVYVLIAAVPAVVLVVALVVDPPLAIGVVLVVAAWVGVVLRTRRTLAIADTFPELARLPLMGRLLGSPR
jgi:O-antigen/teichoic acid export membrane protein